MKPRMLYSAAGLLLLLVVVQASASAITVTVNGQPLPPYPPAIERHGRVLVPMRGVLESLGATVWWQDATRTVTATRGDRTVQMTVNQPMAYVNGQPLALGVPPMLVRGVTYMPLRFPAQALGASVTWHPGRQVVEVITAGVMAAAAPPPAAPAPAPFCATALPPVRMGGAVTGVVTGVSSNQLTLCVGPGTQTFVITPGTSIYVLDRPAARWQVQPGDQAHLEFDARGFALQVRATYQCVVGVVQSIRGQEIVLDTYPQPLLIQPGARITSPLGEHRSLADLRVGEQVMVRVTPATPYAFGVAELWQPPAQLTVTHNATRGLRPGQVLTVHAYGPPGGQAWFDLGTWQQRIPLHETCCGSYQGGIVIPSVQVALQAPVIVHLYTPDGRWMQATAAAPVQVALLP